MNEGRVLGKRRMITYILVVLLLVLLGTAAVFFLNGISSDAARSDEMLNQNLEHSFLSIKELDHVIGNRNAPVVIVEYADSDCQYCKALMPKLEEITGRYSENVAWVYRHSQLPIYPESHKEAESMECVAFLSGEDSYIDFRDAMYGHVLENDYTKDVTYLADQAVRVGSPRDAFLDCFESGQFSSYVQEQKNSGAVLGVSTVPHTFIVHIRSGEVIEIVGNKPLETYTSIIDAMLRKGP